ncbi:MAG: hypothetical protein ACK559_27700 [bacterium]
MVLDRGPGQHRAGLVVVHRGELHQVRVDELRDEGPRQVFDDEEDAQRLPQQLLAEADVGQLDALGADEVPEGAVLLAVAAAVELHVVVVEALREPPAHLDAEEQQVVARQLGQVDQQGVEVGGRGDERGGFGHGLPREGRGLYHSRAGPGRGFGALPALDF